MKSYLRAAFGLVKEILTIDSTWLKSDLDSHLIMVIKLNIYSFISYLRVLHIVTRDIAARPTPRITSPVERGYYCNSSLLDDDISFSYYIDDIKMLSISNGCYLTRYLSHEFGQL